MLLSLALVFITGIVLGKLFSRFRLPALLGMLLAGVLLGPQVLNLLDSSLMQLSPDLRKIALVVILTRAGLALKPSQLKKVGRPALLLCFLPACLEILGIVLLGPVLLGITRLEAALLGSVLAAVSPAVVVPRMLRLIQENRGTAQQIPQMIIAGASVDDVFVIVLFTTFLSLAKEGTFSVAAAAVLPVELLLGGLLGVGTGWFLSQVFRKVRLRDSVKVLFILSFGFLLVSFENRIPFLPFSGLLAVVSMASAFLHFYTEAASRMVYRFDQMWVGAEALLFVLVGATLDLQYSLVFGPKILLLIAVALVFRSAGVFFSLSATHLNVEEKIFCAMAYLPKATVQAAIGGVPLAAGLGCGALILSAAVVSILFTAPLGAALIDVFAPKLLSLPKEAE